MNNRFKFRMWDINTKRFYYIYLNEPIGLSRTILSPKETTVQQHTGLTDKNKKEIYEGDILDFTARYKQTGPVEVIYYGASFGCVVTDDGGLKELWALNHIVQQHYPEIIGNIFENPELLK